MKDALHILLLSASVIFCRIWTGNCVIQWCDHCAVCQGRSQGQGESLLCSLQRLE